MSRPRTFWHLESHARRPSAYEIATSRLHYYPSKGFEVNTPFAQWYERYQKASPLQCQDFDGFRDPRETTYSKYVELQNSKEVFVDETLQLISTTQYDRTLSPQWLETLDLLLPQLRFLFHGFQMVAAYVGQLAPSSRMTIALVFQAADEMRRIQRLAYRMRQLQLVSPDFGQTSRERWQKDPLWQPLRQLIEELLITYDWGEALIALNMAVKPIVDKLFHQDFAEAALKHGDYQLANILLALNEDCQWHREWSCALVAHVLKSSIDMSKVVATWEQQWQEKTHKACSVFATTLPQEPQFFADAEKGGST